MVSITNGVETFTVPEGAVKIYGSMGFRPLSGYNKTTHKMKTMSAENVQSDDGEFDDILSKPISQWNQIEVKEFAAAKGLDVSGAKSLKEAKAIIKDALDEEAKLEG